MLNFLAEFSALINFYDQNNKINGNWKPFLLKDPVFLLAYIAKTKFSEFYVPYENAVRNIKNLSVIDSNNQDTAFFLNQVFNELIRLYNRLAEWTFFMQMGIEKYDLKEYLLHHVKNTYSQVVWAILGLRDIMLPQENIFTFNRAYFYVSGYANEQLWIQNKSVNPKSQLLNYSIKDDERTFSDGYKAALAHFTALTSTGDQLFSFFKTVIHHAKNEFAKLTLEKSKYPDTTLLRVFIQLLQIHQKQLNGIAEKHLKFYYKDILKQTKNPAVADSVYLFAQLAKPTNVFKLPKSTLFNAGLDIQKNPILFSNSVDIDLNPAQITNAYTLCQIQNASTGNTSLYLNHIEKPAVLQKQPDGKNLSWETFGGSAKMPAVATNLGISFASPLLYLPEGNRTITVTMMFDHALSESDRTLIANASYFLSGAANWIPVSISLPPDQIFIANAYTLQITLTPDVEAILPFTKNPDGYSSPWPLLKMEFNVFSQLTQPPLLTNLQIDVNVSGISSLVLQNDFGALNPKKSFTPFGPTPAIDANFIIGSNEVFSKPISSFTLTLNWDNLPNDFLEYYQFYNDYLAVDIGPFPTATSTSASPGFWSCLSGLFKKKPAPTLPATPVQDNGPNVPFNTGAFNVHFSLLQQYNWTDCTVYNVTLTDAPSSNSSVAPPDPPLFEAGESAINPYSVFIYNVPDPYATVPYSANPDLQLATLKYADHNATGFMKMSISAPAEGFGADLYAKVVTYIALQNAYTIAKNNKPANVPVNIPYTPKVSAITASYEASQLYTLQYNKEKYPLQCYHYTPFTNYLVYDNTQEAEKYSSQISQPLMGVRRCENGLHIFAPFKHTGVLYLEMDNLLAADAINFYFDLAQKFGNPPNISLSYYYLSDTQWEPLTVLSDTTNNLSCSGIIQLNVPSGISKSNPRMPGTSYWFSIVTSGDVSSYPNTCFVNTNGFLVVRTGTAYLTDSVPPTLPANAITKPQTAIPAIAALTQPFSSFGGVAAEDDQLMNKRISKRIKSKDRILISSDYVNLIREQFPTVYFTKVYFDPDTGKTSVCIVNKYSSWKQDNAFTPLSSFCQKDAIYTFLSPKVSALTQLEITDFTLNYVQVSATIMVSPGFEFTGVKKNVELALMLFMCPWIESSQAQLPVDTGISASQVAAFIKTITGVSAVNDVKLFIGRPGNQLEVTGNVIEASTLYPGVLLVPNPVQIINPPASTQNEQ